MKTSVMKLLELLSVRGGGIVVQLCMQIAIARTAGAAGVGLIQLFQTWTCLLGEIVALGLPTQAMKSIAIEGLGAKSLALLSSYLRCVLGVWCALAVIAISAIFFLVALDQQQWLFVIALAWSALCFANQRICAEALKALGMTSTAVLIESVAVPLCMTLFAGSAYFALAGQEQILEAKQVLTAFCFFSTLSSAIALLRCFRLLDKYRSALLTDSEVINASPLEKETAYFFGTALLSISFLNLPFFLMPYFATIEEIGFFALAFKCINPISTIIILLGAYYGPRFARSYGGSSEESLSSLLRSSQKLTLGLYLPILCPMLFFSDTILSLFGQEFIAARPYLFILAGAQLINACTGLSGNLLNMAGAGRIEFVGSLLFFFIAIIAGVISGHIWGLTGIAVSYSAAIGAKHCWSCIWAVLLCRSHNKSANTKATATPRLEFGIA